MDTHAFRPCAFPPRLALDPSFRLGLQAELIHSLRKPRFVCLSRIQPPSAQEHFMRDAVTSLQKVAEHLAIDVSKARATTHGF